MGVVAEEESAPGVRRGSGVPERDECSAPRGPGDCLGFAGRLSRSAVVVNGVPVEVAFHGRRRL
jgi:hypothetical protein